MTALVLAPAPWQVVAFPLVVRWQAHYDCLAFYFPDLRFGLLTDAPAAVPFTSILSAPTPKGQILRGHDFRPGELSQWEAYLNFLATQEHQDEIDLKAAIRGQLASVIPQELDPDVLWRLAYELEQMLAEKAAGLERLARQQQSLEAIIGEDLGEEGDGQELAALATAIDAPLTWKVPDLTLARVRYRFWRQVLAPQLTPPFTALVLEDAAGEGSPRLLWDAVEDGELWRMTLRLPAWCPEPGLTAQDLRSLKLGVHFRKGLGELLQALTDKPTAVAEPAEKLTRLVAEELWPASDLPQAQSVTLEVVGWRQAPAQSGLPAEPMVFLVPAD